MIRETKTLLLISHVVLSTIEGLEGIWILSYNKIGLSVGGFKNSFRYFNHFSTSSVLLGQVSIRVY